LLGKGGLGAKMTPSSIGLFAKQIPDGAIGLFVKKIPERIWRRIYMKFRRIKRRVLIEFEEQPTQFGKADLIYLISTRQRLWNYLELCTTTSGIAYWDIVRWRYDSSRRLMYNCPDNFADGLPIDFKIDNFDISLALHKLKMDADKIDICLVDGFHTYDCALRDLKCSFDLLEDGGVLVVHDLVPRSEALATPTYIKGVWNGVSYIAFLDFVLARDDLDYCTVDIDEGCGIIVKNRIMPFMGGASSSVRKSKLASDWFAIHKDDKNVYRFFVENRKQLLLLISAKTFVHGFGRCPQSPAPTNQAHRAEAGR
jgi:Methyltransferase domain